MFFGLPLAALLLAEDGHEIALAASPFADALGLRRAPPRARRGQRPRQAERARPRPLRPRARAHARPARELVLDDAPADDPRARRTPGRHRRAPLAPPAPPRAGSDVLGHRLRRRGDGRHRPPHRGRVRHRRDARAGAPPHRSVVERVAARQGPGPAQPPPAPRHGGALRARGARPRHPAGPGARHGGALPGRRGLRHPLERADGACDPSRPRPVAGARRLDGDRRRAGRRDRGRPGCGLSKGAWSRGRAPSWRGACSCARRTARWSC